MRFLAFLMIVAAVAAGAYWGYTEYMRQKDAAPADNNHHVDLHRTPRDVIDPDGGSGKTVDGSGGEIRHPGGTDGTAIDTPVFNPADINRAASLLTSAEEHFNNLRFVEGIASAETVYDLKVSEDLYLQADQWLLKNREAHWATRYIQPDHLASSEKLLRFRINNGPEIVARYLGEKSGSFTYSTSPGSQLTMQRSLCTQFIIEDPAAYTQQQRDAFTAPAQNALANPPADALAYYAFLQRAWELGMEDLKRRLLFDGLQRFPTLGTSVYQREARAVLRKIMHVLGNNAKPDSPKLKNYLEILRVNYPYGDFVASAEVEIYGDNVTPPREILRKRVQPELVVEAPEQTPIEDTVTVDAPVLPDNPTFKDLVKQGDEYRKEGMKYYELADPEKANSTMEERQAALAKAIANFRTAIDLYEQADAMLGETGDPDLSEKLRNLRQMYSFARKMSKF